MTCEIVIMNREAVAVAADSAVTIAGEKVYNSVHKLFPLCGEQPIAIMIYNSTNFMGVPWETIIKLFRDHLGSGNLNKLTDYGEELIRFLKKIKIPEEIELLHVKTTMQIFLTLDVRGQIIVKVNELIRQNGKVADTEIADIVDQVVEKHFQHFSAMPYFDWATKEYRKKLAAKYAPHFVNMLPEILDQLPITEAQKQKLTDIFMQTMCKDWHWNLVYTGIVITGFGISELFPCTVEYRIESAILGEVKHAKGQEKCVDHTSNAWIMPFAQADESQAFIWGMNPGLGPVIQKQVAETASRSIQVFVNQIKQNMPTATEIAQLTEPLLVEFGQYLEQYARQNYVAPLMNSVAVLPRSELAAMAESLVNLASFKKHVTQDKETVGGLIDVAVLSKIDGFIWVKKKRHYETELNSKRSK